MDMDSGRTSDFRGDTGIYPMKTLLYRYLFAFTGLGFLVWILKLVYGIMFGG